MAASVVLVGLWPAVSVSGLVPPVGSVRGDLDVSFLDILILFDQRIGGVWDNQPSTKTLTKWANRSGFGAMKAAAWTGPPVVVVQSGTDADAPDLRQLKQPMRPSTQSRGAAKGRARRSCRRGPAHGRRRNVRTSPRVHDLSALEAAQAKAAWPGDHVAAAAGLEAEHVVHAVAHLQVWRHGTPRHTRRVMRPP